MSQSVLISTLVSRANPRLSALPWPRMPMLASTTRSLAPRMRLPTSGAASRPLTDAHAAVCRAKPGVEIAPRNAVRCDRRHCTSRCMPDQGSSLKTSRHQV